MLAQWNFNPALASDDKTKLQRDLIRLQDLASIGSKLASYSSSHSGTYPTLPAGTFIVGKSTSAWSSWQAELGNALGSALPVDPINAFNNCPAGYDPNTCWRSSDRSFVCPDGSHVYQYTVGGGASSYSLGANFEFKNVTWRGNPPITVGSSDSCNSYNAGGGGSPVSGDNTPPSSVTISIIGSPTASQLTISWTAATDNGGSGLSHYELWRAPDVGGAPGNWAQVGGPIVMRLVIDLPPAEGIYWYGVHAVDGAGHSTSEAQPKSAIRDATPPADPVCLPAAGTYTSAQQVSCTATDQGTVRTAVNIHSTSGTVTPSCGSPIFNSPTTINASIRLNFITCDAAGNASSPVSYNYTINTVAPTATLTLIAQDNTGSALSGTGVKLDGSAVGVTPTTATVSLGNHTVSFDTLACYIFASLNPSQPMNVTGSSTVTGTYNATVPGAVASPSPAAGASGVSNSPTLNWSVAACASSYDIYLGTTQNAVQNATITSPEFKANSASASYNPSALNYAATYYWRVDARNVAGVTKGTVWSFTTAAAPTGTITFNAQDNNGAGLAGAFARLDGALIGVTPISTSTTFGSHHATFDDVMACYSYASTSPLQPMDVAGNLTVTGTFNQDAPAQANNPTPGNGAGNIAVSTSGLNWGSGGCTSSFAVYFGASQILVQNATTSSSEYKGTATNGYWTLSGLAYATVYYWRIDAINAAGTTKGTVWSFTTEGAPTATLTLESVSDLGSPLSGATVRLDGTAVGTTPTSTATTIGTHTIAFDNSVSCHTYASVSPPQPMNVTGSATVRGTYNRNAAGQVGATGASPVNGATNTPLTATISWSSATCASSYNVYLGTNAGSLPQVTTTSLTSYTPGGLSYSTTYYWRIDSVNNGRVTVGQVLSFTTQASPTAIITFQSKDSLGATITGATARLDGALVGTTPTAAAALLGTHTALFENTLTCYTHANTSPPQPMNVTGNVTVTGTFNLNSPGATLNPNPADGANTSTTPTLGWGAGPCTTSFDVYLGTNQTSVQNADTSSPEFKGSTTQFTFNPGTLLNNQIYYWRVDANNSVGHTQGQVWQFVSVLGNVSVEAVDDMNNRLHGVPIYNDMVYVGNTLGYMWFTLTLPLGWHRVSFNNTFDCYNYSSITPPQPMNVTGNNFVTATFWPLASPPAASPYYPTNGQSQVSVQQLATSGISFSIYCGTSYFDIYFGTNQSAVQNATTSSSSYVGTYTITQLPGLNFPVGTLTAGTPYYWRVDASNTIGVTQGPVWSFTTAP